MATTEHPEQQSEATERRTDNLGEVRASIATGLVKLHSRYYGKGPTQARTYMWDDLVVAVLRGGFTTVEETLVREGEEDTVHHMRRSFQKAMAEEFRSVVEQATGRKVQAYLSQIHATQGVAAEVFVLESEDDADASGPVGDGGSAADAGPGPPSPERDG
jgi:uncharacterized protein YbcI